MWAAWVTLAEAVLYRWSDLWRYCQLKLSTDDTPSSWSNKSFIGGGSEQHMLHIMLPQNIIVFFQIDYKFIQEAFIEYLFGTQCQNQIQKWRKYGARDKSDT